MKLILMIEKSTTKSDLLRYDSQFIKMFPILVSACNGNNSSELLLCLIFVKIFQFFLFFINFFGINCEEKQEAEQIFL